MVNIAKLIDHSLLRPDATAGDIVRLCDEAKQYDFYSVCIHPSFVKDAKEMLFNTHTKITTVIGFPLGMTLPNVKIYEAMDAVIKGADELDLVINIGHAKSNNWEAVEREVSDIVTATSGAVHKVIIETCYLTDEEKKSACTAVMNSGAEFIKTSTGFGPSGAVVKDVELIKSETKGKIGIKTAGGINSLNEAMKFIKAGATRIGTSSGVDIMKEFKD